MKTLIFALLILTSSWVYGTNNPPPPPPPPLHPPSVDTNVDVGVDVVAKAKAEAEASADGDAAARAEGGAGGAAHAEGGAGGEGGKGGAGGEGGAGGNVGDVNAGGASVSINNKTHRQAASAYAPTVFPSATCQGGYSAGVSTPGVGVSFGGSRNASEACLFALSQHFAAIGMYENACDALVATKAAERTYEGREKPLCKGYPGPAARELVSEKPQVVVVPMPIDTSKYVTKEELIEREERIIETIMEK